MFEPASALERWNGLSRADRKAILARLPDAQRGDLMALVSARYSSNPSPAPGTADDWKLFSPHVATLLRAAEAKPADRSHGLTPATSELLLRIAADMRSAQPARATWREKIGHEIGRWLKALDL